MRRWRSHLTGGVVVSLLGMAGASCRDAEEPVAPSVQVVKGDPADPTVRSVVPDTGRRGVTLDITIYGAGFEEDAVVQLERQGIPAEGITTNSTTFVTSSQLIANITINISADTGRYDLAVITPRRKGVGIEVFGVLYELVEVGVIGGTWSIGKAVNRRGDVVGQSCTQNCLSHGFFWSEEGGLEDLGTLLGYTRSDAFSLNDRGQVLGSVRCPQSDAGCGSVSDELVIWERSGTQWTMKRLGIPNPSEEGHLNNSGHLVTGGRLYSLSEATAEEETGVLFWNRSNFGPREPAVREPLPPLPGATRAVARAINDLNMVAGYSGTQDWTEPVVWFRDLSGGWRILKLGHPPGDDISLPNDISGPDAVGRVRVVGNASVVGSRDAANHPVRWTLEREGTAGWRVLAIESLEIPAGSFRGAWVWGVNNRGDAVGHYTYRGEGGYGYEEAVKWLEDGGVEGLLPRPNGGLARARAINDAGRIVGSIWDDVQACERAAFWRPPQP